MELSNKDRIAVIYHDPASRAECAAWIESWGMQSCQYASAEEFLEQENLERISCLITGYALPGLKGVELLAEINARSAFLPVIFLTGYATIALAVRLMQSGAFTVLEKSCPAPAVRASLQEAVQAMHGYREQMIRLNTWKAALGSLTWDERQVAQGIAAGIPNALLAEQLKIGLRTVEKRRRKVFEKLSVDSLPALIELLFHAAPDLLRSPTDPNGGQN